MPIPQWVLENQTIRVHAYGRVFDLGYVTVEN